jgi:hypothetical protein
MAVEYTQYFVTLKVLRSDNIGPNLVLQMPPKEKIWEKIY